MQGFLIDLIFADFVDIRNAKSMNGYDLDCPKQNGKLRRRFQATERIWDRFSEPLLTDHNQYQKQMGLRIHLKFLSVAKSACHSWAASGKA